ncbi:MAG: 50S ribosomal protein L24 [Patescibacteria group bacterium]
MKLKLGDNVLVITGKDRGKTGKIIRILEKANKVVVEKVAIRTKHVKKTSAKAGEIVKYEGPIQASNVMLMTSEGPTRIGYKKLENGEKVRLAKRTKETIEDKKVAAKKKK